MGAKIEITIDKPMKYGNTDIGTLHLMFRGNINKGMDGLHIPYIKKNFLLFSLIKLVPLFQIHLIGVSIPCLKCLAPTAMLNQPPNIWCGNQLI